MPPEGTTNGGDWGFDRWAEWRTHNRCIGPDCDHPYHLLARCRDDREAFLAAREAIALLAGSIHEVEAHHGRAGGTASWQTCPWVECRTARKTTDRIDTALLDHP